jgi:hypothetical protein
MVYRLRENEEDAQSRLALDFDIILTPKTSVEDAVKALENMDNYGSYVSNMRNKASVEKAIEDYFGPSVPAKKKALEKQLGKTFPPKTKQAIDDLVKSVTSRPNLLKYDVKGNTLVFPKGSNPAKDLTKKIIKTVMDSAGIDFTIKEKESVSEDALTDKIKKSFQFQVTGGKKGEPMSKGQDLPANTKIKKSELKEMIKEEIKNILKEGFQGDEPEGDGLSGFRGDLGNKNQTKYIGKRVNHPIVTVAAEEASKNSNVSPNQYYIFEKGFLAGVEWVENLK